jgi:hypothetical protein
VAGDLARSPLSEVFLEGAVEVERRSRSGGGRRGR